MKERFPPLVLLTLDACISRLRDGHPQLNILRQNAAQYQKGYNGEVKLDYHLRGLDKSFSILNDVTLSVFGRQFQIDTLSVTASAIYIIEVKSLRGEVTFHTGLKQLTQQNGEILVGRKYPITQAENIVFNLSRWLQLRKLGGLPIYYFVALADENTVVRVQGNENEITEVVTYVEDIRIRLVKMNNKLVKTYRENYPLKNQVIKAVMSNLEELEIDILGKMGVDLNEILPGVHCPSCEKLGMIRKRYRWHCPYCDTYSRTAHKKALLDYALLYGKEITNRECQRYLNVTQSAAYSLLKNIEGVKLNEKKREWLIDIQTLRHYVN